MSICYWVSCPELCEIVWNVAYCSAHFSITCIVHYMLGFLCPENSNRCTKTLNKKQLLGFLWVKLIRVAERQVMFKFIGWLLHRAHWTVVTHAKRNSVRWLHCTAIRIRIRRAKLHVWHGSDRWRAAGGGTERIHGPRRTDEQTPNQDSSVRWQEFQVLVLWYAGPYQPQPGLISSLW